MFKRTEPSPKLNLDTLDWRSIINDEPINPLAGHVDTNVFFSVANNQFMKRAICPEFEGLICIDHSYVERQAQHFSQPIFLGFAKRDLTKKIWRVTFVKESTVKQQFNIYGWKYAYIGAITLPQNRLKQLIPEFFTWINATIRIQTVVKGSRIGDMDDIWAIKFRHQTSKSQLVKLHFEGENAFYFHDTNHKVPDWYDKVC